jgi:hypothetical protein
MTKIVRNRNAKDGKFISDEKARRINPDKWIKDSMNVPKPLSKKR